jgi:lysophospholipid acyltransferase (LPLAT)-like uncharacterized protein
VALDYPLVESEAVRMKKFLAEKSPPLVAGLIRALAWTIRFHVEDPDRILQQEERDPRIFVFWHNRILLMTYIYERFCARRKCLVLVSRSRDGEFISQVARRFGLETARGSTSKGGVGAMLEMVRELGQKNARDIVITPDGPRGPRGKVQDGVLAVAAASGVSIIPATVHYSWKLELPSWDRFQIPLPGAICRLVIGPNILPPPSPDPNTFEEARRQLEQALGD